MGLSWKGSGPNHSGHALQRYQVTLDALAADVVADGGDIAAEVRQAVLREGAVRLEDYWVRRVPRAYFDPDGGLACLEPAADEMARLLEWPEARRLAEIAACRERHETENALFGTPAD